MNQTCILYFCGDIFLRAHFILISSGVDTASEDCVNFQRKSELFIYYCLLIFVSLWVKLSEF